MNKYYISIIEQMGFKVLNKNQDVLRIYDPEKKEELHVRGFDSGNYTYNYNNYDDWRIINVFSSGWNQFRNGRHLYVNTMNADPNSIYGIQICSSCDTEIRIKVSEYPFDKINKPIGKVELIVEKGNEVIEEFTLEHFCEFVRVTWKHGTEPKDYIPEEFCADKIFQAIMCRLSKIEDEDLQKGIKMIMPSLRESLSDMRNYWEKYALKQALASQNKKREIVQNAIETLKRRLQNLDDSIDYLDGLDEYYNGDEDSIINSK